MTLTNIDHYAIKTNKLEETKAFYELLGLIEGPRPNFSFEGYWLYLGDVALVHLISDDDNRSSGVDQYSGEMLESRKGLRGSGSIDHIAFRAINAERLKTNLEEHNMFFRQREVPNMKLFQIFLEDPNKITVEINYYQ